MSTRLVLVDDHPIVLQGLTHLFERHREFAVVASCATAEAALAAIRTERPDIAVIDLRMPGTGGLDLIRIVRDEKLPCRIVLLTAAIDDSQVLTALQYGVKGLVLKDSPPETLIDAVRTVSRGDEWIDPETMARAFRATRARDAATRDAGQTLTPREIEIVRMVAQGLRNKAIAERLSISEGTVKVHLHNVYEKFGVDGRLELVLSAQQKGWL